MEKKLEICDRSVSLAGGPNEVLVDGEPCTVGCRSPAPGQLLLDVDGLRANAFVARTAEGLHTWVEGRARLVKEAAPRCRGPGGGAGPQVTPPMPAVVVEVLVEQGQSVEKGQGLVVVSAMKMETALVAPHAGTVREIRVAAGDKVAPGDELVLIEAEQEDSHA